MSTAAKSNRHGPLISLFPSAVRITATASTVSNTVSNYGWAKQWLFLLDITDKKTDVDDTLDVFIDFSLDGVKWVNAVGFTRALGNGTDAASEIAAVGNVTAPGVAAAVAYAVTADNASGVTRSFLWGPYMRGRYALTQGAGGGIASFTWSLVAYPQA